ncbi:GNAT family N-acetyltransferase [candidate division KSB1 bacterium]
MSIDKYRYSSDFARNWDYFVNHSDNGTIFHLRKFLAYHPPDRFTDASLYFTRNGKIYAVFPAAIIEQDNERVLYSHPGASYGGFVIGEKTGLEDSYTLIELVLEHARELGCNKAIITQTPSYYFKKQSSYIDFALHKYDFSLRSRELSSVLTLHSPADKIYRQFPENLKRALKKARKSGLSVSTRRNVGEYYDVLKNNLWMRHNALPTHSLEELEALFGLFPDRIKLHAVKNEKRIVAGTVSFACSSRVNLAFYISHDHEFQSYRPVDLAIWELIQYSVEKGFDFLDFGTITVKMEPFWGLARFKEKFGARGLFRDTFERRM